jgi:hypothetical protein
VNAAEPQAAQPVAERGAGRGALAPMPDPQTVRAFAELLGGAGRPAAPGHDAAPRVLAHRLGDGEPDPTLAPAPPHPQPGPAAPDAGAHAEATAPAGRAEALCDLVTRLVEQLYVARPAAGGGDGAVLLRLAPDVLPHTELVLARDARGWRLEARTRSAESRSLLADAADALAERFAARGLGGIRVEVPGWD